MGMDRMNPLDASFLYLENGITHMHIASCAIFEGPMPAYDDVVALFAGKLPQVPRYRQRVRFVPFDLGRPVWVDDPHFKLDYHVRRTALAPPGGTDELEALMGRLMSQELDRQRPLWEAWLVDGLTEGRWALISKVHHSMVDGVAGVDLISVVLDAARDARPAPADDWVAEPEPSEVRLAVDAVVNLARSPMEQLRAVRTGLRAPRRLLDVARGFRSYGAALPPTAATSLDGTIGPHRRWTSATVSLDDIRTIRHGLGGTVNDVVLAAITSGFRDLVVSRGEDPTHVGLRTLVPVSVRAPSDHGILDNRVSAIFFDLPIGVADPVGRLAAVRDEMARLKQSHEPEAGEALTALAGAVPPALTAGTIRLVSRLMLRIPQRSMNTVTTNVPGPQQPLYACGRQMVSYLPYVPIGGGIRVGVAILSYNGEVAFGVTGDYDTAPDVRVLAQGITAATAELVRLARKVRPAARRAG
jgi:diacylglycerol O-acyltransferase